jgi:hypothetical protein
MPARRPVGLRGARSTKRRAASTSAPLQAGDVAEAFTPEARAELQIRRHVPGPASPAQLQMPRHTATQACGVSGRAPERVARDLFVSRLPMLRPRTSTPRFGFRCMAALAAAPRPVTNLNYQGLLDIPELSKSWREWAERILDELTATPQRPSPLSSQWSAPGATPSPLLDR